MDLYAKMKDIEYAKVGLEISFGDWYKFEDVPVGMKVITNHYDRHGNDIVVFICQTGCDYFIHDGGYIIKEIAAVESEGIYREINECMKEQGIRIEGHTFSLICGSEDVPKNVRRMVGAIAAIDREIRGALIQRDVRKLLALGMKKGYYKITTPYLDRHNDYIEIYIAPIGDRYKVSDDMYIAHNLPTMEGSGMAQNNQLSKIINSGFRIDYFDREVSKVVESGEVFTAVTALTDIIRGLDDEIKKSRGN